MTAESGKSREALWLALAPVFVYAFAFTFEVGYAKHYHLPIELIRLDLERVLSVGGSLLSLLIVGVLFLKLAPARATRVLLQRLLLPAWTGSVAWVLYNTNLTWVLKVLVVLGFLVAFYGDLIRPLLKHKGTLVDRWEKQAALDAEAEYQFFTGSLFTASLEKLASAHAELPAGMRIYWLLYAGLLISYLGGRFEARRQSTFLIVPPNRQVVFLRRWGDEFIGLRYDSTSNSLAPEYHLLRLSQGASLVLIPLTLERHRLLDPPKTTSNTNTLPLNTNTPAPPKTP